MGFSEWESRIIETWQGNQKLRKHNQQYPKCKIRVFHWLTSPKCFVNFLDHQCHWTHYKLLKIYMIVSVINATVHREYYALKESPHSWYEARFKNLCVGRGYAGAVNDELTSIFDDASSLHCFQLRLNKKILRLLLPLFSLYFIVYSLIRRLKTICYSYASSDYSLA